METTRQLRTDPSSEDEQVPRGRHFAADGRKVKDLPRVGVMSPDTDPDNTIREIREPRRRPPGRR
jgi:hypothetical protein